MSEGISYDSITGLTIGGYGGCWERTELLLQSFSSPALLNAISISYCVGGGGLRAARLLKEHMKARLISALKLHGNSPSRTDLMR